jgi:hypothetical protein
MKPVLISWLFNDDGELEMACYLELNTASPADVSGVFLRSDLGRDKVALLHVPDDLQRNEIADYVENKAIRDEVVAKLKKAKVRKEDILRKRLENNAADFIASFGR